MHASPNTDGPRRRRSGPENTRVLADTYTNKEEQKPVPEPKKLQDEHPHLHGPMHRLSEAEMDEWILQSWEAEMLPSTVPPPAFPEAEDGGSWFAGY